MLTFPQKIVALLKLLTLAGCSFHSSQWESAKALRALQGPKALTEREVRWWDMSHEGGTYRLFPVAWNDRIVLTDASRWMVVMRNSDILMVRDSLKDEQTLLAYLVNSRDEDLSAMVQDDGSKSSFKSYGANSERAMEISIVEGPIGQRTSNKKSVISCYPPEFNAQSLRLVRTCAIGEKKAALSEVSFDHSGNISEIKLSTPSNNYWSIRRSQDLVGVREVKLYLEGLIDVD